jgi:hypothetical protein
LRNLVYNSAHKMVLVTIGLLLASSSFAEKEVLLKDGSRLRGEVQSMNNGVYEIRTESLGTIKLSSQKIESITPISSTSALTTTPPAAPAGVSQSTFQALQASMTNNAAIMSTIMELQNDPQMKAILADPEVMRAVQNFDFDALASNPKIKALMNNSRVRSIQGAAQ